MKSYASALAAIVSVLSLGSISSAQTTFTSADPLDSLISNANNWDNGLPTSLQGLIAMNANYVADFPHVGYNVVHTDGTLSKKGGTNYLLLGAGTVWVMDGAGARLTDRGMSMSGAQFTLYQGSVAFTDTGKDTSLDAASAMTVHGGSMTVGRHFYLKGGSSLTINGGSLTILNAAGTFGINKLASGQNFINLNGGDTSVSLLIFGRNNSGAQLTYTMGGTTAGSFTAANFQVLSSDELITERAFNWLPGSQMTFAVTGANGWAQAEWEANRLRFNGSTAADLGLTWTQVTTTGFPDKSKFSYDDVTNALSLLPPPPSGGTVITVL